MHLTLTLTLTLTLAFFYINVDTDMPSASTTSEITAVSDKSVGMQFLITFIFVYFTFWWHGSWCFSSSVFIHLLSFFWYLSAASRNWYLLATLKIRFYINSDNTGNMPTDTATSGIGAVADKCVGMQFFIVFAIAYFYYCVTYSCLLLGPAPCSWSSFNSDIIDSVILDDSDDTASMPKDTATSGIRAVADKSVGMQFFIVFTIAYLYYWCVTYCCLLLDPAPAPCSWSCLNSDILDSVILDDENTATEVS